jgi:hypothetical protein
MQSRLRHLPPLFLLTATLAACGGDETAPGDDQHTPASASVAPPELTTTPLVAGLSVRVQIRFFNADDQEITSDIAADHFATLTFTPADFATATDVPGSHFEKDVTFRGTAGEGSFRIGFGHDEAGDERSFGPYTVTLVEIAGARR